VFNRLHVGNLANETTAADLENLFARCGVVTAARGVSSPWRSPSRAPDEDPIGAANRHRNPAMLQLRPPAP
jgi:RNA recognition motif-containing protein